jgi:GNAT superfamily N-acetyltransferase
MKIRLVKEEDLGELHKIDKEYYDSETPLKILKSWFQTFPEGFFVAEDKGKIVAYIFVELLAEKKVIPFIHDAKETHNNNGKYMNVSGLGVLDEYKNTDLGEKLLEAIIKLAKSKKCKQILFITGEAESGHDKYEREIVSKAGFVKERKIEKWESSPGYFVTDHWMWVKKSK